MLVEPSPVASIMALNNTMILVISARFCERKKVFCYDEWPE